jgi:hypothetical protein
MVIEARERCYFKAEGENLLLSPGDETPVEPADVRPNPHDVAVALEGLRQSPGSNCARCILAGRACAHSLPIGLRWSVPGHRIPASTSSPARAALESNPPRRWRRWVRQPSLAAHRCPTFHSTRPRSRLPG